MGGDGTAATATAVSIALAVAAVSIAITVAAVSIAITVAAVSIATAVAAAAPACQGRPCRSRGEAEGGENWDDQAIAEQRRWQAAEGDC